LTTSVLVTGVAGFIGSSVALRLLTDGYEVVGLDNLSTGDRRNLAGADFELVEGDIRDQAAVDRAIRRADVVCHLAAAVGNLRSIEAPVEDSEINVIGTLQVLEAARAAGVRRIVYSSSAAIFGEPTRLPIDEDHPAEPRSPYGVSKLAGEKLCLAYGALYDLDAICLRYFNVYGVNQRYDPYGNVIPIFAASMLRGRPVTIFGDGEQTRDFVNVSDVAAANASAVGGAGASGAYNVASGTATTINRLVDHLSEAFGSRPDVQYAPPRDGEVRHSRAGISAAQAALAFEPQVSLRAGLSEYVTWMRDSA
jgi:UDP-glucose 4-epimerase